MLLQKVLSLIDPVIGLLTHMVAHNQEGFVIHDCLGVIGLSVT